MDSISTLVKIANECDKLGLYKEADEIDLILFKLAQELTPIGQPYMEGDQMMQKYKDKNDMVVIKPIATPDQRSLGQKALDWAQEKAQSAAKGFFGSMMSGLGATTHSEEGAEKASELAGFKEAEPQTQP